MYDVRLPRPFMQPGTWPDPKISSDKAWLLSLELAITSGGPLRSYFHSILENARNVVWDIQSEFFINDLAENSKLCDEARSWLLKSKTPIRLQMEKNKASRIGEILSLKAPLELIEREKSAVPTVKDWLSEVAPEFIREAELQGVGAEKFVSEYENELGRELAFPWQDLGYFAGFLRRRKLPVLAELFHYEWARAQVYYSPQDEEFEEKRLSRARVILNPTVQILRRNQPEPAVIALARYSGQLIESEINPVQAALIDEVSEGFRLQLPEVLANAEKTLQSLKHNTFALHNELETLFEKRILLKGV